MSNFLSLYQVSDDASYVVNQFAEYGRTRRDLARAEPFFAHFLLIFLIYLARALAILCKLGREMCHEFLFVLVIRGSIKS